MGIKNFAKIFDYQKEYLSYKDLNNSGIKTVAIDAMHNIHSAYKTFFKVYPKAPDGTYTHHIIIILNQIIQQNI